MSNDTRLRKPARVFGALVPLALVLGATTGCTTQNSAEPTVTTTATKPAASPATTPATKPATTGSTFGSGPGCASTDDVMPANATTKKTVDVDGDGKADTE